MFCTPHIRLSTARVLFIGAVALASALFTREAGASVADQQWDTQSCAPYGGISQILNYGYQISIRYCGQGCPQCKRYCYTRVIACANGQTVNTYSQVKPYRPEAEQEQELAAIQSWQANEDRKFAQGVDFWRPLSPFPQLLIWSVLIAVSGLAWVGRDKKGTHLNDWGLNVPFNLYFGLSLLTFNTASDSVALPRLLDDYLFFHSWLFCLAVLAFCGINAVPVARGWDYLFVKHPATNIVNTAVNDGTPIHGKSLARALSVSAQEVFNLRPRWHYEHQAEKARKLSEKLDRDAELARAAIARERARAALQDEKKPTAEDIRERVWRGRTLK